MMMFRSILFVIWMYGLMAVLGLLALPALLLPKSVTFWAISLYARGLIWGLKVFCGISVEIRGRQNMPRGTVLYAGKHNCMLDVFIPFLVMPAPAIILKQELLWYPFLGWYALKAAMIPIDRAGNTRTLKKMVAAARERADDGRQIVIFPEGTRTVPGAEPAYHAAGISALAKGIEAPILPVATNAGLCWPGRGVKRSKGTIIYEILPPIPAGLPRKELMSRLQSELETASDALVAEGRTVQGRLAH
ncbi:MULTISPECIES: lysophospholipid acyltransferase family protein [unclassified Hyphomonas]|jgi:1-acyl-sn-glycerol-3-phosphate acyltransferase|uniref:FIG018329: 1-acyl-sn-glycerol-3-phosphate acyltransferase n=1 Tax=hydrothermal vent metagenome TaxID=652676 RepID=A0A160TWL4_9ZZZZ|nr:MULTISPECIES: lysophospholipid acyltransferase family protein [unclassified Hyphomonas]MAX84177.1 1-acyl-sn-glycerol-3-phosphate acyltransferase [Hyphomonas sp.]HAO36795.1 1-acyl-sn-glycerol-3-phosphate acyltransferase [Hyphomonas sp.]HAW54364.1 1-acyl-sn-glycerol-3-phosphate acyltransferase [Hyphomonas sp.]HBJ42853.1 1-acyl-sn-glycerol-3-phosphate acyltransferase [Hyphomonas sp.]HBN91983.1 1-acyl-sn-glycerol-3-phosphate acyltransferase [Hyphomonas sp.]|tara:strand:+ start:5786 stop:6526 length:741 start_codon:yes stop_codon:yes gene_type:complete